MPRAAGAWGQLANTGPLQVGRLSNQTCLQPLVHHIRLLTRVSQRGLFAFQKEKRGTCFLCWCQTEKVKKVLFLVDNVPGYRLQKCSAVVAVFLRLPIIGPLSMKRIIDLCCRDGPCYSVSSWHWRIWAVDKNWNVLQCSVRLNCQICLVSFLWESPLLSVNQWINLRPRQIMTKVTL